MTHAIKFRKGGARIEFELSDIPFAGNAFIPSTAVIPLSQDAGEPAYPVVSIGDHVREGQLIARGPVPVHAPIPGILSALRTVPLPNGRIGEAAVIALRGSFDITGRKLADNVWQNIPTGDICRIIEDRGVVNGFDGAQGLAKDLRQAREYDKPALICRLFDNDPTSPVGTLTLREYGDRVWNGFGIIASGMKAGAAIIVAEEGTSVQLPDGERLKNFFGDRRVSVIKVKPRYPAGSAFRLNKLIKERLTDFSQSGAVFCDSVAALAAYDAVVRDLPSISTNVLILGSAIAKPRFLRVRTGTLIGDIIDECGGFRTAPARIVVNGLIQGSALYDLDTPITRYTRSLHVLDRDTCPSFTVRDCSHCGSCLSSCPSGLDPIGTVIGIRQRKIGKKEKRAIFTCEQCGCCSMVCPSRIPLHHEIAGGRNIAQEGAIRD